MTARAVKPLALCAALAAALTTQSARSDPPQAAWSEVTPGVLRSAGLPCGYALVDEGAALLVGAPRGADLEALRRRGVERVELVLLTHHHRDSTAQGPAWAASGVPVRAAKDAAPWLTPDDLRTFWQQALPEPAVGREPDLRERTFNQWVYLVHPVGVAPIDCSIEDGEHIAWRGWHIDAIATPGHSRDHMAFTARCADAEPDAAPILFAGDALASCGKLWSPYTTDWEHWTDAGLKAASESLTKLAGLKPRLVCPEHGPVIDTQVTETLEETARAAAEAAALKSFERYSKERLGSAPAYVYLAKKQVATAGDEPWSQLSDHLFLTGNTYALASQSGGLLLLDAYGPRIAEQVRTLQSDHKLGRVERVLISHAHNDHYKGIYLLPERYSFQVWTLADVAEPIEHPYRFCAPYVDARPLKVNRRMHDGETVRWHEYALKFHHLPGQTTFTMGVEAVIDGKKCFFTGDNFFHMDQFSGSGGWSGRNRGWPLGYAQSAALVLEAQPDWVLAEHGGAFVFSAEDFRRRVAWARASAAAADSLSPSGSYRYDWDPQRVRVEPILRTASPGARLDFEIVADNPGEQTERLSLTLEGRDVVDAWQGALEVPPHSAGRRAVTVQVKENAPAGRHIFPLVVRRGDVEDGADTFVVIRIP